MAERRRVGTADRPLRVVVVGNSTTFMVVPSPSSVDDDPYAGLLDEALLDRGLVARTTLKARWHATVKEVLQRYEEWVCDLLPDVVVINVGVVDCQARVVPTWFYRHVVTWLPGTSEWSTRYRRHAVPVLRRGVRGWQRRTVGRVPLLMSRVPPRTFRRALELLIRRAVRDHRALVLVLDIDGPGPALSRLQPGIECRIAVFNEVIAGVVTSFADERVVLLPTSALVMHDQETLLPDGLHRSPEAHRRVAALVADAVLSHARVLGSSAFEPNGEWAHERG